jgi:hypothetical protein
MQRQITSIRVRTRRDGARIGIGIGSGNGRGKVCRRKCGEIAELPDHQPRPKVDVFLSSFVRQATVKMPDIDGYVPAWLFLFERFFSFFPLQLGYLGAGFLLEIVYIT